MQKKSNVASSKYSVHIDFTTSVLYLPQGRQSYAGCDFELTDGIEFETCHMRGVNWVRDTMSPYGPRYDHTIGRTQGKVGHRKVIILM